MRRTGEAMHVAIAVLAVVAALAGCATGSRLASDADKSPMDLGRPGIVTATGIAPATPDLTRAQRLVAARTAALVGATVEHSKRLKGSVVETTTPVGAGTTEPSRIESRTHATLPGGIEVRSRTVVQRGLMTDWSASVEWREPDGRTTRLETDTGVLTSPRLEHLDVYALLDRLARAGLTVERWDESDGNAIVVTVRTDRE